MNLSWIDWGIVAVVVCILSSIAVYTKQYAKSVSDFLAANRCAGRYLLTVADGAAGLGVIAIVAFWEMYYKAGFSALWWGAMIIPMSMVMSLSGWITYRYRETRVMTMAQFFEIRYSRKFRIFSGILAWGSGIINYGIFPAVTAKCLIYFCGLPIYTVKTGLLELDITMMIVMFIMLSIAVAFTLMGGQITIMVTDFLQGQLFNIVFVTITLVLFFQLGWSHIVDVLKQAPAGQSMLNPFDQKGITDFNFWYFIMNGFLIFYGYRAWQGSQGFNCSAKNPHEARMAIILSGWRGYISNLLFLFVPICVYVILHGSESALSLSIKDALRNIGDSQLREQVTVPLGLIKLLPVGIAGLMAISFIAAAIATDDSYLHSWGCIFIQDVVMPFRNKPLTPKQHIKMLRLSIVGVAVFAWIFSSLFPLKEYIFMFFAITGAIYLGGAGSAIIGGLYWKRATAAGAWTGMITGSTLAVSGIVLNNIFWPYFLPALKESHPALSWLQAMPVQPFLNGVQVAFFSAIIACISYVLVSLITKPDPNFDMDKLLHRGMHAVAGEHITHNLNVGNKWYRILGIGKEFTKGDKLIYFGTIFFSMLWFFAFLVGTIYYKMFGASDDAWSRWWLFQVVLTMVLATATTIWFLALGLCDFRNLFRELRNSKRNEFDDGLVRGPSTPHEAVPDAIKNGASES